MKNFILSLDLGTTSLTAMLLSFKNKKAPQVLASVQESLKINYPQASWVEQDLEFLWQACLRAITKVIEKAETREENFRVQDILSIGLTNQRESLCVWDKKTGQALCPMISWQCRRSTAICERLKKEGLEDQIHSRTGLFCDPYFTASKISWVFTHQPELKAKILAGKALLGTLDSFVLYRLSGGKSFVTEKTNASRTLLYDLHTNTWSKELRELFLGKENFAQAQILDSSDCFARTKNVGPLIDGTKISAVLGDQQAALIGQTCLQTAEAKCTYGTGAFYLQELGKTLKLSKKRLITTVSYSHQGEVHYALEGASFIAGAAVELLEKKLVLISSASETETLAQAAKAAPELYFVPALVGLGSPWWNPKARGSFLGIGRETTRAELVRACLEGIAFRVCDIVEAVASDAQTKASSLRVDGGMSVNNTLMQIQADLLGLKLLRPKIMETTAFGVALFAALSEGIYSEPSELAGTNPVEKEFLPSSDVQQREKNKKGWVRALKAVQVFAS